MIDRLDKCLKCGELIHWVGEPDEEAIELCEQCEIEEEEAEENQ